MKIGILGAMDQEVALLKASLENVKEDTWHHLFFYTGQLNGHELVVVKCGIGKVASALAATALIEKYSPDYVVNTGSAGGLDTALDIGDVVIGTGVQYHDVDVTHFGYARGQICGMPEIFDCDKTLIDAAEKAVASMTDIQSIQGLICTGDAFMGTDEAVDKLKAMFPSMAATEMEGAAIGQACHMLSTPFLVIRSLSDIAGKTSTVSFNKYIEVASQHSAEFVMAMISHLPKR